MSQDTGGVPDFLLSYKESDRAWAELIHRMLDEAGYSVALYSWTYKASRDKLAEVEALGKYGAVFVPILTPAYMTTINSEHYWFEAFREGRFPVLPIWARECDIERLLFVHEYVDIRDCSVEEARNRILPMARQLKGVPERRARAQSNLARDLHGLKLHALAPVRRVPFERASPYTGGEALLNSIRSFLEVDGIATLLPHENRLSGYGRRKACIEYLYREEERYRLIWVVRAGHPAILAEDFAQLAHVVSLPEAKSRDLPYVVQAVRRWLNENSGWLLLFYEPPSHAAIAEYLPAPGHGHVLISASRASWPEVRASLHVTPWTTPLVEQHLQALLGAIDPTTLARLVEQMHGYPIATDLAARLALAKGWPPDALLERILTRSVALEATLANKPPQAHALAVLLSLCLSELWQSAPVAVDLLRSFAYMDSYNILPGILVSGGEKLPGPLGKLLSDSKGMESCIATLHHLGLIEERFGSITFHHLLQGQLREWMEAAPGGPLHEIHPQFSQARSFSLARAEGPLWCRRIVDLLLSIFPESAQFDVKSRQAAKLISHIRSVLEHAARLGIERGDCIELWSRLGEYLLHRELLEPAREALEHALKLDKLPQVGASERRYALFKALGQVCAYDHSPSEAVPHFEQGLRLAERRFGRKHPKVSEMRVLLGNARRKSGDLAGALAEYEEALDIDKTLNRGPHEDTMRDLMLIGITRQALGDQSTAWSNLEEALSMQQVALGLGHISLAQVSRCMARLNRDMGDIPGALHNLKTAIQVTERLLGCGHPSLADDYIDYGDLLVASKQVGEARKAYKAAFKILQAAHGQQAIELLDCSLRLGDTAMARGEATKALQAYEFAAQLLRGRGGMAGQLRQVEERIVAARAQCPNPRTQAESA